MRFTRRVPSPAAVLAVGLSLGALGAPGLAQSEARKAGAKAEAGKGYNVDTKASRVYMKVEPDGRGHSYGVVGRLASGAMTLGASKKAGELVFDLTSFQADAPEARKYVGLNGALSDSDRR